MLQLDSSLPENEFFRDEILDSRDPLRHLMDDSELEGIIASDGLARPSGSLSELLTVLPQQSQSVHDGLLTLSFAHTWPSIPSPISTSLVVDAAPGCGGLAWPAGQILASYLVQRGPDYIRGKNILELGSGTGLVGLVVGALRDAKTWITDQAPLLPIMKQNVSLNKLEDKVIVAELNWGSPIPADIPRPDIILAADCVYFEPAFPLLVQTLNDLSDSKNEIYFCYKKRRKADKRFFGMLKKHFTWKEARVLDDPNRQIYNREAITLIQLFKIN
ncbi:Protein-lysine N-methyltransferase EFM6 [Psilocybe cubensis]|uniref:Protein-lysine N-methyltransferase EFM6 n=2 Tax=Psilocybe cubensis TaxID=181762 RepID=A0A8H7XX40_PSICU|nr:Protein-lysine N-methyltransferase EFM6 [Psilocybe cubensis]KAH9482956.1 Protein-lysine N-methyltransferase EFM6 [Psilocybe cubensis]